MVRVRRYKSPARDYIGDYISSAISGRREISSRYVGQLRNLDLRALRGDIDHYLETGQYNQRQIRRLIEENLMASNYEKGFWKKRVGNVWNVLQDIGHVTTHPIKALKGTHPIIGLKKILGIEEEHVEDKLPRYEKLRAELEDEAIPSVVRHRAENLVKYAKYGRVTELMYDDKIIRKGQYESLDRGLRKRLREEEKGLVKIIERGALGKIAAVILLAIATFSLVTSVLDNPSITGYAILGISQATNATFILNLLAFIFVLLLVYPSGEIFLPIKATKVRKSRKFTRKKSK